MIRNKNVSTWVKYKLTSDVERKLDNVSEITFDFSKNVVHMLYSDSGGSGNRAEFELTELEWWDWGPKEEMVEAANLTRHISRGDFLMPEQQPGLGRIEDKKEEEYLKNQFPANTSHSPNLMAPSQKKGLL